MVGGLTMACTSDLAGLLRGKGFPTADLDARAQRGIGWTPTNVQITCFDTIAPSPFGSFGDVVLRPDPATRVAAPLPGGGVLSFLLGDIFDLDGAPWDCCTRGLLKAALARLKAASGLEIRATFEHEFMLPDGGGSRAFSLAGFAERLGFAEALLVALEGAGIAPDSVLREYGPNQMEVTLPPQPALRAADEAAILRELVRAVARGFGLKATFAPLIAPEIVGNGVHVHLSLWDAEGRPATHDPARVTGLSATAGAFVAGLLRHASALTALTAPSAVSFMRLTPHRWSAAYDNLAVQDREACVRVCPLTARDPEARARQFNVEFRAADACASPHFALAALVHAGAAGIEAGLPTPVPTAEDLSLLGPSALAARGLRRLPGSLEEALVAFEEDGPFRAAFPPRLADVYLAHKRRELSDVAALDEGARLAAYASIY